MDKIFGNIFALLFLKPTQTIKHLYDSALSRIKKSDVTPEKNQIRGA